MIVSSIVCSGNEIVRNIEIRWSMGLERNFWIPTRMVRIYEDDESKRVFRIILGGFSKKEGSKNDTVNSLKETT